ncbi:MAG: hypothetical protein K1566_15525 [Candidatus Thiodiazotropha sp. (ex. Lucinisca nassula)]|nr:hypothetical protein [Candidatus Thiodiazotropha sp. (ex. Lucinisca nassula)]MBW9271047.1 hypothetical protein [Candidatus Thiodiazotropha sp. (ex. Lucinisca nassula)]
MLEVFRADTRKPDVISNQGFEAWQPLSFSEAMNVLKKFCGEDLSLNLKSKRAERLIDSLKTPIMRYDKSSRRQLPTGQYMKLNKNDLSRLIKSQKTRDSFWISTDESEACGGQANGYIYRMVFDSASMNLPGVSSFSSKIGVLQHEKMSSWVRLLIDASHKIIALNISGSAGAEISFLTRIPQQYIKQFKPLVPDLNLHRKYGAPDREGWYALVSRSAPPPVPSRVGRPKFK